MSTVPKERYLYPLGLEAALGYFDLLMELKMRNKAKRFLKGVYSANKNYDQLQYIVQTCKYLIDIITEKEYKKMMNVPVYISAYARYWIGQKARWNNDQVKAKTEYKKSVSLSYLNIKYSNDYLPEVLDQTAYFKSSRRLLDYPKPVTFVNSDPVK